jgi:hypothetical protein
MNPSDATVWMLRQERFAAGEQVIAELSRPLSYPAGEVLRNESAGI